MNYITLFLYNELPTDMLFTENSIKGKEVSFSESLVFVIHSS